MARPQEIDYIWHASNDRAALAVNILYFSKCALLVKSEATETTELRMEVKIQCLSVRMNANFSACRTEVNALSRYFFHHSTGASPFVTTR
jgi:hypothetical protein